jgi:anti-sigma-K factor RskA
MNYEKLSETLDKKILDFNLKILGLLASILIKPLALATEPFFRKNFGDRYFTGTGFVISIALWGLVEKASYSGIKMDGSPLLKIFNNYHCYGVSNWLQAHNFVGKAVWIVAFTYGFLAGLNLICVQIRRRAGKIWHSMSPGESIFGGENIVRDILIAILAVVILYIITPALGVLFFMSQCASNYLATKRRNSFYNRYLDIVDAKIENEFMQQALDRGVPPEDTAGLFCPLPKAIKGEYRVRVARVVAGTHFAPGAPVAAQGTVANTPDDAIPPWKSIISDNSIYEVKSHQMYGAEIKRLIDLGSRIRRFFIVAVVIVVCVAAVVAIVRFVRSHRKPPTVVSVAGAESVQPQKAISTTGANSATTPVNSAAPAQNGLDKQENQERAKIFEQIKNELTAEAEKVSKFNDAAVSSITDNHDKIQKLNSSFKDSLNAQNARINEDRRDFVSHEGAYLDSMQNLFQSATKNPKVISQQSLDLLKSRFSETEQARQEINKKLNALQFRIAVFTPAQ